MSNAYSDEQLRQLYLQWHSSNYLKVTDSDEIPISWFAQGFRDRESAIFIGDTVRRKEFEARFKGRVPSSPLATECRAAYDAGWMTRERMQNGGEFLQPIKMTAWQEPVKDTTVDGCFFKKATRQECLKEFANICSKAKYVSTTGILNDMSHWFEQGFCASDGDAASVERGVAYKSLEQELTVRVLKDATLPLQISQTYLDDALTWFCRGWNFYGELQDSANQTDEDYLKSLAYGLVHSREIEIRRKLGWVTFSTPTFALMLSAISKAPRKFRLKEIK